jgi:GT2 family glycosyltransferase
MMPMDLEIIVPTRNRPEVLARSLRLTRAHFPGVPILVHDDASEDTGSVALAVRDIPGARLMRSVQRIGPAGARNKLLSEARARWCLAIDDDCFPRKDFDPSRWIATDPAPGGPIVISFRCYRSYDGNIAPPGEWSAGPSRTLMGGASLLHREGVLNIGGYRSFLVFAGEDTELARRVWASGSQVWSDPCNYIVHDHVPVGRDLAAEYFYYVRNRVLVNVLTLPLWYGLPRGIVEAARRAASQERKLPGLAGFISGLIDSFKYFRSRTPMTLSLFRWLSRLPV